MPTCTRIKMNKEGEAQGEEEEEYVIANKEEIAFGLATIKKEEK